MYKSIVESSDWKRVGMILWVFLCGTEVVPLRFDTDREGW